MFSVSGVSGVSGARVVCLRCGPHVKACEAARGGKRCPAPKTHASGQESYDRLVEAWYERLRRRRARNFPEVEEVEEVEEVGSEPREDERSR